MKHRGESSGEHMRAWLEQLLKEKMAGTLWAESKPQPWPPSSPPTGQDQRATSLTAAISNGANILKQNKKPA